MNFIWCCVLLFCTLTLFVVMYCCSAHKLYLVLYTAALHTNFICCYVLLFLTMNQDYTLVQNYLCSVYMYIDNTRTTLMKSNDKAKITKGSITEAVLYVKTLERNSKEEGCVLPHRMSSQVLIQVVCIYNAGVSRQQKCVRHCVHINSGQRNHGNQKQTKVRKSVFWGGFLFLYLFFPLICFNS